MLSRLESRDWTPNPPAPWPALLRRLYLDLTGLPPTPEEQNAFLESPSHEKLDQLTDQLLARRTYGERWARHWLDLVRYAESNGYERDATKPFVWRYRDYVIQAFNSDKPFNRFILEQLAGDELDDASTESLIATGYNRLGHWDDEPADPQTDRFDQLDDIVSTTSQVFLGLTLGCARCHDHKFDPLTTRDYYSMVAIFNPLQRPQNGRTELTLPAGSPQEIARLRTRDRQIADWKEKLAALRAQPRSDTTTSISTIDREVSALEKKIKDLLLTSPDLPQAYFLHEPSSTPPLTHILLRGSPTRPGPEAPPAVPDVLTRDQPSFTSTGKPTSQRRLTLARWLGNDQNPLTARVLVNRVWRQHFGTGLVRTPNDFGLLGQAPTHPELLDWLADWFVHDANWSLKELHRLILASQTFRISRASNPDYAAADPENHLLWRLPYQRLEVEAIRDSMLAVSGQLNHQMFGPSFYAAVPRQALEGHSDPNSIWKPFDETDASRRTIYAFIKRSLVVPMLEVLDLCDTTQPAAQRQVTTVAPQALTLFNGDFVNRQAQHLARRLLTATPHNSTQQIETAYRLALCRPPSPQETEAMLQFLRQEEDALLTDPPSSFEPNRQEAAQFSALQQMCRVILNLNEFVYPD